MRKLLLLLMVFIVAVSSTMAQRTVTGKVTGNDGAPMVGVTVVVKETVTGTITNIDGEYSVDVPDGANVLLFSFIGMKTQEVEINNQTEINVTMEPDVIGLEEVVAIGYGTVKKKDLTGAVTQIDAEKMEKEATTNITSLLRGSIPGLNVNFSQTAKGLSSSSDMLVRGQTSLRADNNDQRAANAPLIVVDGMIYYGDLADINPVDIEAFDILKDASSAAIYGSRASNGVILITTKKGRKGKPTINVSTSVGVATPSHKTLPMLSPDEFIQWRIAGFESNERHQIDIGPGYYDDPNNLPSGVTLDQWKAYDGSSEATDLPTIWLNRLGFSPIEITNYKNGTTHDWQPDLLQTGLTQDYNVSMSGSSDAVSYYFSLGYVDNEGIRYNEEFSAVRSRLNLEGKITDWLSVGTNSQFSVRDESSVMAGDGYGSGWTGVNPFASYYEQDGETIMYAPTGNVSASRHPHLQVEYIDRFRKYNALNTKVYAMIDLPFGFSFNSEFITRFNWDRDYNHYDSGHLDWGQVGGIASRRNTTIYEWQINNIVKWNKEFGDHTFDFTFVQNAEKYQYWRDHTERRQFQPSDILGYHRLQAATEDVDIWSDDQVSTGDALLARLNYTWKGKYLFTGSFRRDGYSAFGQSNPHANFGSAALGWTISEEDFFNVSWLDLLKLRASYGTNGNRGVGIYDALANLNTGKFVFIEGTNEYYVSQLYSSRMANPGLKWERTSAYNFGLDFSTMEGRVRGNIELYHMITKDLLIPRQLPDVTGYASVFSNLGQVNNTGFELALNTINVQKGNFDWLTNFSFSYNKNVIKHLYYDYDEAGNEVDDLGNEWFIGHAIDEIWDYELDGIWQEDEVEEAHTYSRDPGDFKQVDQNGDGYYDKEDKIFQGNRTPKYRLTMRNDLNWRNWEMSVKMYSYLGYFSANNHRRQNDVFYDRGAMLDVPYWTPENPSNEWARVESYETGFNVWENNSFVRVDNISLSYNIPQNLLQKVSIVNCKLSLIAQNPYVWAPHWQWMDPEVKNYTPTNVSFKINLTL
jgi:TonB-linked SusC/RagA family outer membrane protein